MERLQGCLDPGVVPVLIVSEEVGYGQLDLEEVSKAVLDLVKVVRKTDSLDLALGELDEVVQDTLLVNVEVIHRSCGYVRLDYLSGCLLTFLCGDLVCCLCHASYGLCRRQMYAENLIGKLSNTLCHINFLFAHVFKKSHFGILRERDATHMARK